MKKQKCLCIESNNDIFIYSNDGKKYILSITSGYNFELDTQEYAEVIIDYCPFCGRKLGGN